MRQRLTALVLILIAPLAHPAAAQDGRGAGFDLAIGRNLERGENFKRAASAFALDLPGGAGLQADLAISKFQTADTITPAGGLHLTWDTAAGPRLGVFAYGETPDGGTIVSAGIEALHEAGPWRIEGYAAANGRTDDDATGGRIGIDLGYRPGGRFDALLTAGAHADRLGGDTSGAAYLGGWVGLGDGLSLGAELHRGRDGDSALLLGIGIETGGPARFGHRDGFAGRPGF